MPDDTEAVLEVADSVSAELDRIIADLEADRITGPEAAARIRACRARLEDWVA